MDVWDYFMQKQQQFSDYGVSVEPTSRSELTFAAEPDTNEQRGFMFVKLGLMENTYVQAYEHVVVRGAGITREAYAYVLVIDGATVRQWHRDPKNHPDAPVHEHVGPAGIREVGTPAVTLGSVLDLAWKEVSLRAEAPLD